MARNIEITGELQSGRVIKVLPDKGYGFIKYWGDLFIYFDELPVGTTARVGDEMTFVLLE